MKLIIVFCTLCLTIVHVKSQQYINGHPTYSRGQYYPTNEALYFSGNNNARQNDFDRYIQEIYNKRITSTSTQSSNVETTSNNNNRQNDFDRYIQEIYNKRITSTQSSNVETTSNNNNRQNDYDKYIQDLINKRTTSTPPNSINKKNSEVSTSNNNADTANLVDRLQVIRPGDSEESSIASNPVRFFGIPKTEVEQLNNVTYAITTFGNNLMKSVNRLQTGNIIVSPTSIATVLALLQQGVTGEAQNEITRSLLTTPEVIAPTYRRLTYDMKKRNSRNILTVSNNLYISDGFDINPDFKDTAIENFGSEITTLDFSKPAAAVRQINKWIAIQTHNRIENLLPESAVSPTTQLVVANAVYFKGLWETKFKKEATKSLIFRLSSGESKTVPFMRMRHSFKYGIDEDTRAHVVTMPFERHQYSLILVLPHQLTNVDVVLDSLTHKKLVNYLNLEETEVQLEIPKFTIKSETNMIPVLKGMGVSSIFSQKTDLSGIGTYRTFSPEISQALHTGYLSVDEQGLSAVAASAFVAVALSYEEPTAIFQANRPFLAVLWDTQFAIPLFIARIEDPSQ